MNSTPARRATNCTLKGTVNTQTDSALRTPAPREAAMNWAAQRLELVLTQEDRSELAGRAEVLVAIAERYEISIELLIEWIDAKAPQKQWVATEWRRWCEQYRHALLLAGRGER